MLIPSRERRERERGGVGTERERDILMRILAGLDREREREKERGVGSFQDCLRLLLKLPSGGRLSVPLESKMAQTLPLLLLAVLNSLSCHSEVRARDPDVEEEEAVGARGRGHHMPGTFGMPHKHHSIPVPPDGTPQNSAPPSKETIHQPEKRG